MNPLKLRRINQGVTIAAMAEATGVSRHTLMRLELGASPQAPTAKAVADFYGVMPSDLWDGNGNPVAYEPTLDAA